MCSYLLLNGLVDNDSIINYILVSASNGGQDQECTIQHHDHVVLNGDTLDALMQLFPELVDRVVDRVTVFSSSSAAQIDSLLKILQRSGRDLSMIYYFSFLKKLQNIFKCCALLFINSCLQEWRRPLADPVFYNFLDNK